MHLTGCTQEEAEQALRECNNDTVDAIDKIMKVPETLGAPKKKELDEAQKKFFEMRKTMEAMDRSVESGFISNKPSVTKTDQPDVLSYQETNYTHILHSPPLWSDSNHTQQNQINVPELEEQIQGTACLSQSE